jgi:DNA-binding CsgD family transcriptional regulator
MPIVSSSPETSRPETLIGELARTVSALRRLGCADRSFVIELLRRVIAKHLYACGIWAVFESDAFDNRDHVHRGQPGQDASGRFIPRWHRNQGDLRLDCSHGHDSRQLGGWYFLPCSLRREVIFGPYDEHPLTGMPYLMVSRVAPLFDGHRCIGAVGLDVALDHLPHLASVNTSRGPASVQEDSAEVVLQRGHCFLSPAGDLLFAGPRARHLLTADGTTRLPAPLLNALRTAIARGLTHHQCPWIAGGRRLRASFMLHPHRAHWVLSLEDARQPVAAQTDGCALLSPRETEVLGWVEEGKTNAEIAVILGISPHTVRHHLEKILPKLGVENRRSVMLARAASHPGDTPFPVISHTPGLSLRAG